MYKESGSASVILAVIFGMLFTASLVFGFMLFASREDYKNNVDEKIKTAVEVAVQDANTAKDTEFLEKEKQPNVVYSASATFGSLSFSYPKTWSVYSGASDSDELQIYFNPGVVPSVSASQAYALTAEITDTPYADSIKRLDTSLKNGTLSANAFKPEKVSDVLGLKATGLLDNKFQGMAVYLPLRDKTLIIKTLSQQFLNDFETTILPTLTFVP